MRAVIVSIMKRAVLLIAAPVAVVCLCGAALAQTASTSPRALFSREPSKELAQSVASTTTLLEETAPEPERPPSGVESGMSVTSDSRAYCARLIRSIDRHDNVMSSNVATLRSEGQQLCAEGYIRLGVTRLREALAIIKGRTTEK